MKTLSLIIISALLFSCSEEHTIKENATSPSSELPMYSNVPMSMDMSKNADDFVAHCQTCHTARYIEMQPKLSRKAWQKTVDKMIHAYGAPIDSLTAIRIVDYLVWLKEN